jgi:hypothetical protein
MNSSRFNSVRAFAGLAAALALSVAWPAGAADPVFPLGSRIGLVPPNGMVASEAFVGFADPTEDAAILITALPAAAYSQIEKTLGADVLKKQGVSLQKREPIKLAVGRGLLFIGRQTADKARYRKWLLVAAAPGLTALVAVQIPEQDKAYPDRVIRAALATLAVRTKVPDAEELSLLPFEVGDLAGFGIDGIVRGRALMLSDGPNQSPPDSPAGAPADDQRARLLIAALPGGPTEPADHENFARLSFNEIGGIRNVHVTMSEPLRIGGQPGYQTLAEANDARSGADVMVVQWLRFGSGGYLQMIGVAPAAGWTRVLARLRTVRDSVEPK